MHNLEHGYTILWYDETIADDADMIDQIEGIAKKLDGATRQLPAASSSPRRGRPTTEESKAFPEGQHIAFTHWSAGGNGETDRASRRASGSTARSPAARRSKTFMKDYPYTDSPRARTR